MIARANTTISVLRGEIADEYGDFGPKGTPVLRGIQASIIEKSRAVFDYDSPTPRTVHYAIGRVNHGTDIRNNDTVLDEITGVRYLVNSFSTVNSPLVQADMKLDLEIVT